MLANLQRAAQSNGRGLRITQELIQAKIANGIETLRCALPKSAAGDAAIAKLEFDHELIKRHAPSKFSRFMGIECRVGYAYFNAWRTCTLRWKGTERNPIPDDWHHGRHRSSTVSDQSHPNRNATHPVNAMLNYSYAVLESHVRQRITGAGLDPSIGFLHRSYGDKLPFVYDLIEPLRPIVDRQILTFIKRHIFSRADFTLTDRGVCRLNPQLARNVVRAAEHISGSDQLVKSLISQIS